MHELAAEMNEKRSTLATNFLKPIQKTFRGECQVIGNIVINFHILASYKSVTKEITGMYLTICN